jgi:hypothetical protein
MHLTGGVVSGLNELDVLNYWRQNPVSGDQIINYVSIDPKNHTHIQQAILLFGVCTSASKCSKTVFRSSTPTSRGLRAR